MADSSNERGGGNAFATPSFGKFAAAIGAVPPGTRQHSQGRVVNWDDIIIDAAATDTGMRRSNNQDSNSAVRASNADMWRQRGHIFMVADGMGAHAVGELASKRACDNTPHYYNKTKGGTPAEAISKAFRE